MEEAGRASGPGRVLYLADSFAGPQWYRCHVPGTALRARGYSVVLKDRFNESDIDGCDVLVAQRLWQPEALRAVHTANQQGKLTVFDADDDYWSLHPANPAFGFWSDQGRQRSLAEVARACRRVTVPTRTLGERLSQLNADVRILPNMLPDEYWPSVAKSLEHETPLVVGWAGSPSHGPDLATIEPVLLQMLDEFPDVEVVMAGVEEDFMRPHERLRFLEHVRTEDYARLLENFDIGLAPLQDTRFNTSKSDLKVLEYSMIGLPVVASKVMAYSESVRHGETGFLAKNPKDWLRFIRNLVHDGSLRERMGRQAHAWAQTRLISRNTGLWERAYDLTDGKRVPGERARSG